MRLSTNTTDYLAKHRGVEEVISMIAKAGFDAFDLSLEKADIWGDDPIGFANKVKEASLKYGIPCNQSHAPFPSSVGDEEKDEEIFKSIVTAMEIASIAGADVIVVHPKQHLKYAEAGNPEKLKAMNLEFYKRLVPYCEKFNIKVAAENMWQFDDNKVIIDSTCASSEEFCEYIDMIDSPYIVGCLDLGHVALVRRDLPEMIRRMGNSRIRALHVHDNDLIRDNHVIPYTRNMTYYDTTTAFADIGYDGDFTFEADAFFAKLPPPLLQDGLNFAHAVGRFMIAEIESKRK
ncbi:MAG: sugar phosphate isomerase/epimerase [Clostridia bacterium]|jgi:sugar phosphate isomerase/epimerase|nr:sugar phosphate isomerase/epimerase [Clostridia bacterium]